MFWCSGVIIISNIQVQKSWEKCLGLGPGVVIILLIYKVQFILRSSRKAWLLTTTLFILFHFYLPSLKKEGRRQGERIAKIVIKSHAFLLDLILKSVLSGKQNMLENVFCFQANYQIEINKNVLTRMIKIYKNSLPDFFCFFLFSDQHNTQHIFLV